MSGNRIRTLAWVTSRGARGHDDDEPPALAALTRTGVAVDVVDWDDPTVDWARFDRVVLRSTWDYPERLPEFLAWLDRVAAVTDLLNRPDVVRWSLDKHYLADLAAAGLPVTPTVFAEPGTDVALPAGRFVVKPAVGAGSRDAAAYGPEQHATARAHVARLHAAGRAVLLQPFLASVPADGEWPMVFFDGRFSHAASKRVTLPEADPTGAFFAAETNTIHTPSAEQVAVAEAVMDRVTSRFGAPAYGRVDLVRDDDGRSCVLELELTEPYLFLRYGGPAAVARLVDTLTDGVDR